MRFCLKYFGCAFFLLIAFSLQAAENLSNVVRDKPDPQFILKALKFDNQENLEESRRVLQGALAFDPGNPDYHFELSRVYGALYDESSRAHQLVETHLLTLSQNELEQVLMIRPEDIPAHYNLGVIYKRRGNMERARDKFRRVLKLSNAERSAAPVTISTWMQIGSTYEDQGFFDDAKDAYMKARELGGNRPEIQSAIEDLRIRQQEDGENQKTRRRADPWIRQYVSGSEYAQFGSEALRAQSQNAGVGALLPVVGQILFQQFMDRRAARAEQTTADS